MERQEDLPPPNILLSATRLLYHMGNIFRDNAPAPAANGIQIDRKRLARLRQKRVALGHKPDDHELEQQQGFSMKFHTTKFSFWTWQPVCAGVSSWRCSGMT